MVGSLRSPSDKPKIFPDWDKNLKKYHPEANFLQSSLWFETNWKVGHKPLVFTMDFGSGHDDNFALSLVKCAKRGRYLEVPGGPILDWENEYGVREIMKALHRLGKSQKCAFVRLRPQLENTPENLAKLKSLGLRLAPMHLHAEHTLILDLGQSEETILANMRRQTRYEVRRAEKQGIKVESVSAKNYDPENPTGAFAKLLDEFYQTQQETASRQHFIPPSRLELEAECSAFGEHAALYVAKTAENEPIAYGLFLNWGDEVDYFEAASTDLNRKLPGAYALQWQAIKDFKKKGLKRYNFWGIAPPNQPHHRYAKVTTFKTGFGGKPVNFVPAHDIVISKPRYLLNLAVETLRKKFRHLA